MDHICGGRAPENVVFENVLSIFKSNLHPGDYVTENCKQQMGELICHVLSKNGAIFDKTP